MVYNEGMTKRAKVLWIDLEMTGLEPMEDRILEVAAIATDWNFTEIARYEAVVKVDGELMRRRMVGELWEKYADVREALVKQNETGKSVQPRIKSPPLMNDKFPILVNRIPRQQYAFLARKIFIQKRQ